MDAYHTLEIRLTHVVLVLYILASVTYLLNAFFRARWLGTGATIIGWVGLALHTAACIFRGLALGRVPFMSGYDFALCFMWAIVVAYLVAEVFIKRTVEARALQDEKAGEAEAGAVRGSHGRGQILGAFVFPGAFFLWLYAFKVFSPELDPEILPALKNPFWLVVHVVTAIIAYGVLFTSFVTAWIYLGRWYADEKQWTSWQRFLPSQKWLDGATYAVVAFGFPFLTLTIITGAVWANQAWARPWGWDPKEVASLIAWLVYLAYLHVRLLMGWRGIGTAIFAIIGFLAVVFTYVGVNYLQGLHSYGAPG